MQIEGVVKVVVRFCEKGIIFLLLGYRYLLSPLLPCSCRFFPTCSTYALESIERYGIRRGVRLSLRRLLRCHPLNAGGFDPVQ